MDLTFLVTNIDSYVDSIPADTRVYFKKQSFWKFSMYTLAIFVQNISAYEFFDDFMIAIP